jgi:hypothetical protein
MAKLKRSINALTTISEVCCWTNQKNRQNGFLYLNDDTIQLIASLNTFPLQDLFGYAPSQLPSGHSKAHPLRSKISAVPAEL